MSKKQTVCEKVKIFEEEILTKHQISLSDEARDQIFWLYDNGVEFTFSVDENRHTELKLEYEEDVMGFKLRWD